MICLLFRIREYGNGFILKYDTYSEELSESQIETINFYSKRYPLGVEILLSEKTDLSVDERFVERLEKEPVTGIFVDTNNKFISCQDESKMKEFVTYFQKLLSSQV